MLSSLKVSIFDQWRIASSRPVFLILTLVLVVVYPAVSHPAGKQSTEYGVATQDDIKKSQESDVSANDYGNGALSQSEEKLYEKVKSVLKHQTQLESANKELTKKLALKNEIIKSLEYNEQILWNQLETNEKKFWDALTAKDKENEKAKELADQLATKDSIIKKLKEHEKALEAKLEYNKRKFEIAIAAIDPNYEPTEERTELIPNSLFGYSPPEIYERSLKSEGYGSHNDSDDWYDDAIATKSIDGDHPWSSVVCITCHDGYMNHDNDVNVSSEITGSEKNILWDNNIDVSDYIVSDHLSSNQDITTNYLKSSPRRGDSISALKGWTSPSSDIIICNDEESHIICSEDSENDGWWHWFYQKISTLKTSVAETIYFYL